jgi:hypothetical protein
MLYYAHDIVCSGKNYIVSKICEDQRNLHYKLLFAQLDNLEVDFHLLLSMFTISLTRTQQNIFGEILNMVNRIFVKKEIYPLTSIPSNYDHFRRLYLDGDIAMTKHLPIPDIKWEKATLVCFNNELHC